MNSAAFGQYINNSAAEGTFSWSDRDLIGYDEEYLVPQKSSTFLVRSKNGMGVNVESVSAGVNVSIGGHLQIQEEGLLSAIGSGKQGTIETSRGCFYYLDGKYWQLLNAAFEGDPDMIAVCGENHPNKANISYMTCQIDGFGVDGTDTITLRAGDRMVAYNAPTAILCDNVSVKREVTCKQDGTLNYPQYKYANCLPSGA